MKVVNIIIKTASEPAAKLLKLILRNQNFMFGSFAHLGQIANEFEHVVNAKTANPNHKINKEKLNIPKLDEEEAFVKGIDYFMEVLLVYGFLGLYSIFEIRKAIKNSKE